MLSIVTKPVGISIAIAIETFQNQSSCLPDLDWRNSRSDKQRTVNQSSKVLLPIDPLNRHEVLVNCTVSLASSVDSCLTSCDGRSGSSPWAGGRRIRGGWRPPGLLEICPRPSWSPSEENSIILMKFSQMWIENVHTFYILHSTFYILHSTFYILHSTFYILHSTFLHS